MQDPEFQRDHEKLKPQVVAQAVNMLRGGTVKAVEDLLELVKNGGDTARASACRALLEFGFKAVELEDLTKRLEALEAQR